MTLQTGTKLGETKKRRLGKRGISYVEVMVTLVFLSVGLTSIFKTFIASLDQLNRMTSRLYANTYLDNQIIAIERDLKIYKTLPLNIRDAEKIDTGQKVVSFEKKLNISEVDEFIDIFELDVSLSWKQGQRDLQLSRATYISDY